jgi:hypothetical protein
MTWNRRYIAKSYIKSSLWVVPFVSVLLFWIISRITKKLGMDVLMCVLVGVLVVSTVNAQQYVYPAKGQTPEQQKADEAACYSWAVQQTGFDPAKPPPQQPAAKAPTTATGTAPGAGARGAAKGAVVGEVVGNDAGAGAAAGAVAARSQSRRQNAAASQQASQQQQAASQQQQAAFSKARATP